MAKAPQSTEKEAEESQVEETSDLTALLEKEIRPRSDRQKQEIEGAVRTIAEHVLRNEVLITDDVIGTINGLIAEIDRKLSDQINHIIHHDDFQQLEGSWRGLHHLVSRTETDEMLKIQVLNISKKEVGKTLQRYQGAKWDQSPLFKKIYGEAYDQLGGDPYGCLVGDYHFDHSSPDVKILSGMSQIAAAAHAPFFSSVSPTLFQMDSWEELPNKQDITKIFGTDDYAEWRALRDSEDSKYVGLTMPRFLARAPYDPKNNPVEGFYFEEDIADDGKEKYVWANSAYAMAANITRAFKEYGWLARIRGVESGGTVEDLPLHTFPSDDGGVEMKCPTEISIGERRDAELSDNGLIALVHRKSTNQATFIAAQSLHRPAEYDDPVATANSNLGARLPYMFSCCRFAHYLKSIVRDKLGSFYEREEMEKFLSDWVLNYVVGDPENATETVKAKKPLAEAKVVVDEVEGNPGYYRAKFFLRPHYQLDKLDVSLRLVSQVPAVQSK